MCLLGDSLLICLLLVSQSSWSFSDLPAPGQSSWSFPTSLFQILSSSLLSPSLFLLGTPWFWSEVPPYSLLPSYRLESAFINQSEVIERNFYTSLRQEMLQISWQCQPPDWLQIHQHLNTQCSNHPPTTFYFIEFEVVTRDWLLSY